MSEEINNPHDKGYKFLLSSEKVFLELLQSFVDMGWVSKIVPGAITRIDKSYILQDFSEKEADLVYRLKIKDQEVIFYLLMEMQSTVDFQMPYRLLLYMVEIWRDILKNTGKEIAERKEFRLPAIVPIILYNGDGKWTASRSFKESLAESDLFKEYVVDFQYILIDVNRYEKKTLMDLANLISAVFLLDQAVDKQEYLKRLLGLGTVLRKFDSQSFQLFTTWFKGISIKSLPEHTREEVIKILDESNPEEVEQVVSNMEQTLRKMCDDAKIEGLMAGKEEVIKNMLSKNMAENLISEVTGLPIEQIRKIKKELH